MPTPRHYATNAERQAAYRARHRATAPPPPPPAPPGPRQWTRRLQQAQALLDGVAEEMAAYRDARADAWHESARGERFTERFDALEDLREWLRELPEA